MPLATPPALSQDSTSTSASSAPGSPACGRPLTLATADPDSAGRRRRARGGGLRRLGSQRWLVLGAVRRPPMPRLARRHGRPSHAGHARRHAGERRRSGRDAPAQRASTAISPRVGRWRLARSEAQRARALAEVDDARALGMTARRTCAGSVPTRPVGCSVRPTCWVPPSLLTAPRCSLRSWPAAWRTRSRAGGSALRAHRGDRGRAPDRARSSLPIGGTVRADVVVVRATEAWTPGLPGLRRALAPAVLAHGGHRAPRRTPSGPRPASAGARPSPTTDT